MILSAKKILELNAKYKLIENLDPRESDPEGIGIDIRVGEVHSLSGPGFLGTKDRDTPKAEKIADIEAGNKEVMINPRDYLLVKTIERVNLPSEKISIGDGSPPSYLMLDVYPRSTLQRCGIYFMGTKTDPGYSGELTFALANLSNSPFRLELGARIANAVFLQVSGELSRAYGGQWQGGRVSTTGLEKQV